MPSFETDLSDPNVQFTRVQPRRRPDIRENVLETVAKTAVGVGKGVARKSAAELTGVNSTLEEINDAAEAIDAEIQAKLKKEEEATGGPLQDTRVNEIKDEALSQFANNDRVLLALRDQGTISTIEARARRRLNLQRALSNPINALFKGEFLNTVSDLTGGSSGADQALFPFTPEEEQQRAIAAAQEKAIAEIEGQVAGLVQKTGKSPEMIREELRQQQADEVRIAELQRATRERTATGEKVGVGFASLRNSATRGISSQILEFSQTNNGNGLNAQHRATVEQLIVQQEQGMVEALNRIDTIGNAERDAELERINKWATGIRETVNFYDSNVIDQSRLEELELFAKKEGWRNVPEMMYLNTVSPTLFDAFMKTGGNISGTFDRAFGEGSGKRIKDSSNLLRSLADFADGRPTNSVGIPPALDTPEGMQYISDNSANKQVSPNLRKMYHDNPGESLTLYNGVNARLFAIKDENIRKEMASAMSIAKTKMDTIRTMIGKQATPITATTSGNTRARRGGAPKVLVDIPDTMVEHADTIKMMYRIVETHPWAWSHVRDDYIDSSDAFNGFMRGEWEFNVSLEGIDKENIPTKEEIQPMRIGEDRGNAL